MGWVVLLGYVLFAAFWIGVAWAARALVRALARQESRSFPKVVRGELRKTPERRSNQHLVDLELRDGRRIRKVRVEHGRYPALIGGRTITRRYNVQDVVHVRSHYGPIGAKQQVGGVAAVGIAGFAIGAWRNYTDYPLPP